MNVHCSRSGGITFSCQALALLCECSVTLGGLVWACHHGVLCCPHPGQRAHRTLLPRCRAGDTGLAWMQPLGAGRVAHTDPGQSSSQECVPEPRDSAVPCVHTLPSLTCPHLPIPGQPGAPQHPPHSSHRAQLGQPCPCSPQGWHLSLSPSLSHMAAPP